MVAAQLRGGRQNTGDYPKLDSGFLSRIRSRLCNCGKEVKGEKMHQALQLDGSKKETVKMENVRQYGPVFMGWC